MPSARASQFNAAPRADVNYDDDEDTGVAPPPELSAFEASSYQREIFHWFRGPDPLVLAGPVNDNLVVIARAGSGKTTTILRAVEGAPEAHILLTAFNKPIQEELDKRVRRMARSGVEALTLHSLGYRAIRREFGYIRTCERFEREDWLANQVCGGMPYGAKRLVAKLVTKAREIEPTSATVESLVDLAMDFDLVPGPMDNSLSVNDVARATMRALGHALSMDGIKQTGIDFADMIYLPLALDLMEPEYDMVVTDEYQDMTHAQALLARAACKPGGRMAIFGDDRQCIYGFRGADVANIGKVRRELNAATLKLPRTYRCPLAVVALAQKLVPDFEPNPQAKEGVIDTIESLDELVAQAQTGDFVLSRTNAPLMRVALKLLRENKPAIIRGRDFGGTLQTMVRQLAKGAAAYSLIAFLGALDAYQEKTQAKLLAMKRDDRVALLVDKCDTLRFIARDMTSVGNLGDRIKELFVDRVADAVICSTVHKAKGLESNRVFLLEPSFYVRIPCECGHQHAGRPCPKCQCETHTPDPARKLEEDNIRYVAVTRTKHQLTHCTAKL